MGLSKGFDRLVSCDALGGYYAQANYVKGEPIRGYIQSCTSEKCCAVYFTRKWTSKRTGAVSEKKFVSYFKEKAVKYKTNLRSELKDFCPDCNSTLFTERARSQITEDSGLCDPAHQ